MKHLALFIAIGLLPIGFLAPAVADDSLYGHNLVVNGDAEAGAGLPGAGSVPGWNTSSNTAVGIVSVRYGYDSYIPVGAPGQHGTNFFSGGTNSALSTAGQSIDVSAAATDIDAHRVRFTLSAYIGGYSSQADSGTVTAVSLDANGLPFRAVQNAVIGPVTVAERRGVTGLWYRTMTGTLPVNTRRVAISMRATRASGTNNDGYFDEVSFVLRKAFR
jgi:hypothetical protein